MGIAAYGPQEIETNGARLRAWALTGDTSYTTGGYSVTAAQLGLQVLRGVFVIGTNTTGYSVAYNVATGKIQFYANGTEVSSMTDIHTKTVYVLAVGED